MGAMTGDASRDQPPCGVPAHRIGLSARRFSCDPTATNPADDPTVVVGTSPPKTPTGSGVSCQPLASSDQALGASVNRSQPKSIAVAPSLARLAKPRACGRPAGCAVQVMPRFEKLPRQARGAPVTGLESTANSPSANETIRPSPVIGGLSILSQVWPSGE